MEYEELLERHSVMWEQPELFLLVKTQSDSYPYIPIKKTGIIYPVVLVDEQIRMSVIKKMLEAGVKVLTEPQRLVEEDLWTKRKHEFVLVEVRLPIDPDIQANYVIYHMASGESLPKWEINPHGYNKLCQKMIESGVEVWSREKWNKHQVDKRK
ncbi:MAG: hypothetical protein AAFV93_12500 [Chloroflexota bacterium]